MDKNKYIETIKKRIASKAKEQLSKGPLNLDYFQNLLPEISSSLTMLFDAFGYPELDSITLEKYYNVSVKEYLSVNPIDIDPSNSLTKQGFQTWLTETRKTQIVWNYSDRYFTYLEDSGRSEKVVNETRVSSLDILEKIGDPKSEEPFYVKGLVVGSVQSGKTGNFNAVINRAIDAGYKLIIVLSGIMEDLRSQTQLRIESDVIGTGIIDLEKETKGSKGVGKIRRFGNQGDSEVDQVVSITSYKSDFNKALADADFSLDVTNVLVCKKNVSVLRNLIVWLHDYLEENKDKHDIPLLILDDEADNASLNNAGAKGKEYASKTNGHIRALLDLFKRKTYLGYTATPFANVLQDRNGRPETDWVVKYKLKGQQEEKALSRVPNIFPDDFIVLLNPPSNYIGAKQIFETVTPIDNIAEEKIPLVEIVNDQVSNFPTRVGVDSSGVLIGVESFNSKEEWEAKFGENEGYLDYETFKDYRKRTRSSKADDGFPRSLPSSIKESIKCFILSIAIRESRKPSLMYSALFNPHHSMLIHISRFTLWQNDLKKLIDKYVKELQSDLENDDPHDSNLAYGEFERAWYKYYAKIVGSIGDYLPKGYEDEFLTPISFETLKNFLVDAISGVEVKAINSVTNDKLVYSRNSPKKVIAIGGNRLSRGFTLEGLSINYFVRSTDYSDTLLQMGRWFGYRPGYLDCCKLFTTPEAIDKFDDTTRTIEELETEFRKMDAKGKSPQNFILRVRKHPGTLKITRPSILKNAKEVKWSYQDQLEQTTVFSLNTEKINNVWKDFRTHISTKYAFDSNIKGFVTCKTDAQGVINILTSENNFDKDSCNGMIKFIELCQKEKKLTNWTIAIKTTGRATSEFGKGILEPAESGLSHRVKLLARKGPDEGIYLEEFISKKVFKASGKSANIISGGKDLAVLLNDKEIQDAENQFVLEQAQDIIKKDKTLTQVEAIKLAKGVTIPERVYRERMSEQNGLLLVYLFDPYYVFLQEKGKENTRLKEFIEAEKIDLNIPLVGYAIGFPPIEDDPGGVYVQGDYDIEMEEDEHEGDTELPDDYKES